MKYFYDHETDALSLVIADFAGYDATEEIPPNVIVHVDAAGKPLAVEFRSASSIVDTAGLIPMDEREITAREVSTRLRGKEAGQKVLAALTARHPVVVGG